MSTHISATSVSTSGAFILWGQLSDVRLKKVEFHHV